MARYASGAEPAAASTGADRLKIFDPVLHMRVLISAEGNHEPAGHHLMAVDGHQFLIDLSGVQGALVDPSIRRVEWGSLVMSGEVRDGGTITRQDGSKQHFLDRAALEPYLAAWRARRDELMKRAG